MFSPVKKLFLLTQNFFLYSLLASVCIFFVQFSPAILQVLASGSDTPNADVQKTISQYFLAFLKWLNELPHANDVIVGLFWAVSALLLYLLYIFGANIIIASRNELVVDQESAKPGELPRTIATRFGNKIAIAIAYFVFLIVSLVALIPYWMNLLNIYVYSGMKWENIGYFVGGMVGMSLTLYLVTAAGYIIWKYEESV